MTLVHSQFESMRHGNILEDYTLTSRDLEGLVAREESNALVPLNPDELERLRNLNPKKTDYLLNEVGRQINSEIGDIFKEADVDLLSSKLEAQIAKQSSKLIYLPSDDLRRKLKIDYSLVGRHVESNNAIYIAAESRPNLVVEALASMSDPKAYYTYLDTVKHENAHRLFHGGIPAPFERFYRNTGSIFGIKAAFVALAPLVIHTFSESIKFSPELIQKAANFISSPQMMVAAALVGLGTLALQTKRVVERYHVYTFKDSPLLLAFNEALALCSHGEIGFLKNVGDQKFEHMGSFAGMTAELYNDFVVGNALNTLTSKETEGKTNPHLLSQISGRIFILSSLGISPDYLAKHAYRIFGDNNRRSSVETISQMREKLDKLIIDQIGNTPEKYGLSHTQVHDLIDELSDPDHYFRSSDKETVCGELIYRTSLRNEIRSYHIYRTMLDVARTYI